MLLERLKITKLRNLAQIAIAKFGIDLFVITLFLALTLILLYPFSVLNMNTQLIGVDGGDTYQNLWNLWWVKHSILSLSNPYMTSYVFYPIGTDLFTHTLSPLAGIFSIPFQFTMGLIFSYNFLIILSFVLAGYGTYHLTNYLIRDNKAAFFSGVVFGFSTYHLAHAWGHLQLVSVQWIPFYILFLIKMRKEAPRKNALYAAFFLLLATFWADLYYLVFLGIFTIFFLIYNLIFSREGIKKLLQKITIMSATFFAVFSLIMGPLLFNVLNGKYAYAWPSSSDSVNWSADLISFFIPNNLNLFFGQFSQRLNSHFESSGVEGIVYVGYTVLILGFFAALKTRKTAKFWLMSALVFLILSLGPILHIFGNSNFTVFHVNVPLPEMLFSYISPIPRAPSRFMVLAMLSLAVLSAIAIKYVNDKFFYKFKRRQKAIGLLFLVALCGAYFAEINMVPFPVIEKTSVPPFYQQISKEKGTFGVIDLPQNYWANNYYMYYSTVSEKPIVGGAISRVSPTNLLFLQAFPIINQMAYVEKGGEALNLEDILMQDANLTNLYSFQYFNVKYVILHRDFMTNVSYKQMDYYLSGLLGSPVYCDEQIEAFSTNSTQLPGTFSFLSSGWYDQEERLGVTTRWMDENGTIDIVNPIAQNCSLNFNAVTGVTNKHLKVVFNGEQVGDFEVNGDLSNFKINSLPLKAGLNQLSFYSDQYFVPANIYLNDPDSRRLSIAFQNVSILPQLT